MRSKSPTHDRLCPFSVKQVLRADSTFLTILDPSAILVTYSLCLFSTGSIRVPEKNIFLHPTFNMTILFSKKNPLFQLLIQPISWLPDLILSQ